MREVISDILDHLEGINTGLVILCLTVFLLTIVHKGCSSEKMSQESKKTFMTECVKTHTPTECALGWKNSGVN